MRRLLIAAALALLASLAQAQPLCWPGPDGAGTVQSSGTHADGRYWFHHCPTETGVWRSVVLVARSGYVPVIPELRGMSLTEMRDAIWNANVTLSCNQPTSEIAALCAAAFAAANAADPTPPPSFEVKPNPQSTTVPPSRMIYARAADGARGGVIRGARADVGAVCMCIDGAGIPTDTDEDQWCPLADDPARAALALCTSVP